MTGKPQPSRSSGRFALFNYGFRPFFLLSGLYALIAVAVWLWLYRSGVSPFTPVPAQLWHGHEMLFGFIAASVAGFLLTAVASWTGTRGFGGAPLVLLTLLWLAGRLAFASVSQLPPGLVAAAELSFLPALMFLIAPSLLRALNRNSPLLLVLAALWVLDALFLWGVFHDDLLFARRMLLSALDVVLVLITVIGGRIVPAFTSNALKQRGIRATVRSRPVLERLVLGSMIGLLLAELLGAQSVVAYLAALAAIAQLLRFAGWQARHTLTQPIVWVLHAGYAWLPLGLGLRALWLIGDVGFAAHWLHALGAGAAATMILGVMTRAALGHTGRPLHVTGPIPWAYGLLALAAVTRVFGPALLPLGYITTVTLAAALWMAAFGLYALVYLPILVFPRIDGRPG